MASSNSARQAEVVTMLADCTIRSIDAAYQALHRATTTPMATVRVDCSEVEQVDIAFVQLIVSAQATFAARSIHFGLDPAPACIRAAFARSGIHLPGIGQHLSF